MRRTQIWIGLIATLLSMNGAAAAADPEPLAPYAPIFLMYSGEPSSERLQGLRQFLAANNE